MAYMGNYEKFREAETLNIQGKIAEYKLGELVWEGGLLTTLNAKPDLFFPTGKRNLENKFAQQERFFFKYVYMNVHTD